MPRMAEDDYTTKLNGAYQRGRRRRSPQWAVPPSGELEEAIEMLSLVQTERASALALVSIARSLESIASDLDTIRSTM